MDTAYAVLSAVQCGRLYSEADKDGYLQLMWKGRGQINAVEAVNLCLERDRRICEALIEAAYRATHEQIERNMALNLYDGTKH